MTHHTMRRTGFIATLVIAGLAIPAGLPAQESSAPERGLSVSAIVRAAPEWNLSVRRAAQTVASAEDGLDTTPGWDSSSLSLNGDYERGPTDSWQFGTSIRSEPFPQLALQAGIDTTIAETGELSVREFAAVDVSPLSPARTTWEQTRDYHSALIRFHDARAAVARDAEAAALRILVRRQESLLAEQILRLREQEYEVESRRRELGESSFQDVQDRQLALIEARQEFFRAQQRELRSETDLARLIPLADARIRVQPLSLEELRGMVEPRLDRIESHRQSTATTPDLQLAEVELTAQESQLRAITPWRPDLTLTAGVSFPSNVGEPVATGGVEVRVSPSQDNREQRRRRQEVVELQRLEVAAHRSTAELERQLALQSLTLERDALEAAEVQLQRDRRAEEEAALLRERGARTELQLEQVRLNRRRSEIAVYQSAVDVYQSVGVYLDLVVASDAR